MPNPSLAERNDSLVQLALKKIGQLCCRHEFMLLQHRGRLAVRCRYCLRESKGFVVGEMPETVRDVRTALKQKGLP